MENRKWVQTYVFIWSGQFISMLTSYAVQFAIIIWLSLEHRSAEVLAFAGISGMLPQAIIGTFAGVFIDRWNRKKVLIVSDIFLALCALVISFLLQNDTINLNWIYLMLGLRSIGNAFHSPAMQTVAPLLVPKKELIRVAGINQMLQSVSGIVGPAVGTLAITYMPISTVLYLDIIGAIIAIVSLVFVHIPHIKTEAKLSICYVIKDLKDGLNNVLTNKGLTLLFLYAIMVTFFIMPTAIMFPLLTTEYYNGGKWEMSVIEIAWSVGMLLGGTALGFFRIKTKKITLVNTMHVLLGTSFLLCGLIPSTWFIGYAVLTILGGIALSIFSASFTTIIQLEVVSNMLGRVFSIYYSLAVLPSVIGLLFTGALAEEIGISNSFLLSGSITILIGIVSFLSPVLMKIGKSK
ncbi:MFS transporter [Myroides sp. 1354]|uniref:MFS transporter n=1 Tax=unclassified Myroides TaxID=2642485 RepID=UPI0025787132|nr:MULTISPECIES: MFS transporter [unclassified Myroides]MDM1044726.1 MFS transporter [Myroides sp. R163-1]MDM1055439.1 MFS transporter [Myroides sp. 1354]MDM1068736.1 MFS transporter [Myroides sp. 1372]